MDKATPVSSPLASHLKLSSKQSPSSEKEKEEMKNVPYVLVMGSLRNLRETSKICLCFGTSKCELVGFTDADMAGMLTLESLLLQQRYSSIFLGSSLTPSTNSSWLSPSGLYAFGFYKLTNGYAVGIFIARIPEKTVVWTANRDDPVFSSNAILLLTGYGRLILQQEDRDDVNIADPAIPAQSVASASMLDNGNFMLYDSSRRIRWQSFDHPTDTLLPGQCLPAGEDLVSSASKTNPARGIFRLAMQTDGNLVQYPVQMDGPNYAYYSSGTYGRVDNVSLILDNDGHLYLFNGSTIIRNITTGRYQTRTIYLVRIEVDGILRLYYRLLDPQGYWTKEWSPSEDKCTPLGLCGLNGFCIQMDTVAECECLPGFDHVNPGNWTSGCERNFAMEGCKASNPNINYEIKTLDNTVREDANYAVLEGLTKEDCGKACLEDCNCDAALLKDRSCRKQRLPLRYGRRFQNSSDVALIKVSTTSKKGVLGDPGKEIKKEIRLDVLIISISLVALSALILKLEETTTFESQKLQPPPKLHTVGQSSLSSTHITRPPTLTPQNLVDIDGQNQQQVKTKIDFTTFSDETHALSIITVDYTQ
ncbi:G-type lectin S-receptor-like serine/threonine-protein kinase LECRK3 [Olea europaea var. sylvestris]|uniref:G-type lectin S-receptor-like serine/threonine-protein kinase LECRK3 n=1 Tax=Olea europaea var. sylvestris TaxID=158386 RepID=UPI000C1D1093|nr:G-type lectin S-receptor-like serine/threonine-protein kinase LECRK3 [Olea europaea var. sylvestris]